MKLCSIFVFLCISLCTQGMASEDFFEKMVVRIGMNADTEQEKLLELKMYFIENPTLRAYQDSFHLQPSIERVDDYYLLVMKPIPTLEVRNTLLLLMSREYPNSVFIKYPKVATIQNINIQHPVSNRLKSKEHAPATKRDVLHVVNTYNLQWIAIWMLAVIGLVLSLLNRRNLSKLTETQRDISTDQKKIESEITQLGTQNA